MTAQKEIAWWASVEPSTLSRMSRASVEANFTRAKTLIAELASRAEPQTDVLPVRLCAEMIAEMMGRLEAEYEKPAP